MRTLPKAALTAVGLTLAAAALQAQDRPESLLPPGFGQPAPPPPDDAPAPAGTASIPRPVATGPDADPSPTPTPSDSESPDAAETRRPISCPIMRAARSIG